ncbi:unnamed protein product [Caenorhabditis sp. 36 PRJEB53466]|nr:unnamed protein product [Caenorhabditis sp. 36 PRJEB53466]
MSARYLKKCLLLASAFILLFLLADVLERAGSSSDLYKLEQKALNVYDRWRNCVVKGMSEDADRFWHNSSPLFQFCREVSDVLDVLNVINVRSKYHALPNYSRRQEYNFYLSLGLEDGVDTELEVKTVSVFEALVLSGETASFHTNITQKAKKIDVVLLVKSYVKHDFFGNLFISINDEHDIFHYFYRNDDRIYMIFMDSLANDHRLFLINFANRKCLRKYIH